MGNADFAAFAVTPYAAWLRVSSQLSEVANQVEKWRKGALRKIPSIMELLLACFMRTIENLLRKENFFAFLEKRFSLTSWLLFFSIGLRNFFPLHEYV